MQCDYYDAHECRSCTELEQPYAEQLAAKNARVRTLLDTHAPHATWHPPVPSALTRFRNKAKLVVGGEVGAVTMGILGDDGQGVDLRDCLLYEPVISDAIPAVAAFVEDLRLLPYNVAKRRGELKYLVLTGTPDDELAVRFVLRSTSQLARIQEQLPTLFDWLPGLRVASASLLPEHKAVVEGSTSVLLSEETMLPFRVGDVTLFVQAGSFFQTNTQVAAAMYAQAREWIDSVADTVGSPTFTVWDLFCGVGGFALHSTGAAHHVVGVETSADAVACARRAARVQAETMAGFPTAAPHDAPSSGVDGEVALGAHSPAEFVVGDALAWAREQSDVADVVVVNPPRRGLGSDFTSWLEGSGAPWVLYSSCHAETLLRDLDALPSYEVRQVRVFDLFPHTQHAEVMTLLRRT